MMNQPVLRASAASRWIYCAEAAFLEAQYPEPEGDAAKEGTAAHEMAECILTGTVSEPLELFDRSASNGVVFVAEMADPVMMYVEHVQSHGVGYWVEEEIMIDTGHGIVKGRCDGAAFGFDQVNGILYIDDFKYGHRAVEAYLNWQQFIYGVGIMIKYGLGDKIKKIVMSIIQPRSWHHAGPIRSWTIEPDEINRHYATLVDAVKAAYAERRMCQTGPHCRDCRIAHCNAAKLAAMNAVDVAFAALPDADTPEQVSALLDTLERAHDAIKHTLNAIQSRAESMITNGQPVPGRSLQPGSGHRKWKNEQEARTLGAALGVVMTEEKTITPAEAKRRGVSKEIVESMTIVPSTAPKLIKMDVTSKANEVFNQ